MTTNKLDEIEGRHNHDAKYQFSHDVRCYGFEPDVGIQAHEDRAYLLSRVRELEAALEASENKARGYQNIAGACLSGTNEADKILEENPPTGFNWSNAWSAAYKSHTASRDATIAACIKTIKEERDRLRAILDAPVTEEEERELAAMVVGRSMFSLKVALRKALENFLSGRKSHV